MRLNRLNLTNFKNYKDISLDLSHRVNVFVGNNAVGKTNILDSIYYLSFCKSYFNNIDSQNINHDENYMIIKGRYRFDNDVDNSVSCSFKKDDGKHFSFNKKEYNRLADHIGIIPLVIITPSDSTLIYDGSEERRKYIDGVISQFDNSYLNILLDYNKVLKHRNRQLKTFADSGNFDIVLLSLWDDKLVKLGNQIFEKRQEFLKEFIPVIQKFFSFISPDNESPNITYKSQLIESDFMNKLNDNLDRDRALRHTSVGIHRDDLIFEINGYPIKKFGSQGQQKSFITALKLAQFEFMKNKKGFKPLLLLDDIFDKLDSSRVKQLMKLVSDNTFGQIFITDTNKQRIERVFQDIEVDIKIFQIENSEIKSIESNGI